MQSITGCLEPFQNAMNRGCEFDEIFRISSDDYLLQFSGYRLAFCFAVQQSCFQQIIQRHFNHFGPDAGKLLRSNERPSAKGNKLKASRWSARLRACPQPCAIMARYAAIIRWSCGVMPKACLFTPLAFCPN